MMTRLTFKPMSKRRGLVEISYSNGTRTILEANRLYAETVAYNDRLLWKGPNEWAR